MEIVIAPDKFKGTLTAAEAAGAIAEGIDRAARRAGRTDVRLVLKPMADGASAFWPGTKENTIRWRLSMR